MGVDLLTGETNRTLIKIECQNYQGTFISSPARSDKALLNGINTCYDRKNYKARTRKKISDVNHSILLKIKNSAIDGGIQFT